MSNDRLKDFLNIKNSTDISADLYFYGDIVSDSWGAWQEEDQYPEAIRDFLKGQEGKDLNIFINSGGGSVFAGIAIYNMLKRHNGKKTVHVDGLAASIASVIALAGDEIIIPKTAMFMIHKPYQALWGGYNSTELSKLADDLDNVEKVILNIYEENLKENVSIDTVKELVNNETWLTGEEAEQYFNVKVEENTSNIAACASDMFKNYKKIPKSLLDKEKTKVNEDEEKIKMLNAKNKVKIKLLQNICK